MLDYIGPNRGGLLVNYRIRLPNTFGDAEVWLNNLPQWIVS